MKETIKEMEIAKLCSQALACDGIAQWDATLLLFAMVYGGVEYQEAMEVVADYIAWAPERLHSQFCYALLNAGLLERPSSYFERKAKEVAASAD